MWADCYLNRLTLNDLERHNGRYTVLGYFTEFFKKTAHFCFGCRVEFGPFQL